MRRDHANHLSPNCAWSESAAAGALHIQLGGTHSYFGKTVEKPTIGDDDRPPRRQDIRHANRLLYASSALMALLAAFVGGFGMKHLREGFTTGSCAASAALACCLWQRDGRCPAQVQITVPAGRVYAPEIIAHGDGSCGVIKDSGDDPDVTNGLEIRVRVEMLAEDGEISFRAGEGVGVVTEDGLKIPRWRAGDQPSAAWDD